MEVLEVANVSIGTSDILNAAMPLFSEQISFLIKIFEWVGILFLIYLVWKLVDAVLDLRHKARLKRVEHKIDLLLNTQGLNRNIEVNKKRIVRKKKSK